MNTYRLTNTSHTEVALGLPLLSLPNSFGASRQELFLFDDSEVAARLRDTDDAAVVAQASKIAELLRATDISYL
jgi:cohesin loading factor subunit SCC2